MMYNILTPSWPAFSIMSAASLAWTGLVLITEPEVEDSEALDDIIEATGLSLATGTSERSLLDSIPSSSLLIVGQRWVDQVEIHRKRDSGGS